MKIGLRIDVDTFRGTRYGVPNLCKLMSERSIKGSFFFSVGPDNMGRHLLRMIRPAFLWKMLRTKAASLYGWDVLFRGTLGPGPIIGEKLGSVIRAAYAAGHEVGLHAWDHYTWQAHIDRMESDDVRLWLNNGVKCLTKIHGRSPSCSASPAWKCNDLTLLEKNRFSFNYNSDCRGKSIFYPLIDGNRLSQPQIPVTLPTYDEIIGRNGVSNRNYNEYLISLLNPGELNVLTIHAEVEGISCISMFFNFVETVQSQGASFVPLGRLLEDTDNIKCSRIITKTIPGRPGWISCQSNVNCT